MSHRRLHAGLALLIALGLPATAGASAPQLVVGGGCNARGGGVTYALLLPFVFLGGWRRRW